VSWFKTLTKRYKVQDQTTINPTRDQLKTKLTFLWLKDWPQVAPGNNTPKVMSCHLCQSRFLHRPLDLSSGVALVGNVVDHVAATVTKSKRSWVKQVFEGIVDGWASSDAAYQAGGLGSNPGPGQTYVLCGKVALFCNPASGGTLSSTAIEIIKWVKKIAVAQAKCPTSWGLRILHSKNSLSLLMVSKDSIEGFMH
jgi:hypothetical protein